MQIFIDRLMEKIQVSKSESDFTYFFNLLVAGEAITKIITLIIASSINKNEDRHQYRILYDLVRANGIGDWSKALDDILTGPASQYLPDGMRIHQTEITKKATENEWQCQAVNELLLSMNFLNIGNNITSGKKDLKSWFKLFTEIRNKTRGHGAPQSIAASNAAPHLAKSINLIVENISLLKLPSAYLKRNLNGKYRITTISNINEHMESLKSRSDYSYDEGIYVFLDKMLKIPLIKSDPDLTDFYISNGSFSKSKYEMLSYFTDNKTHENSDEYTAPKGRLPASESKGADELIAYGNCFSNAPTLKYEYIDRSDLEDELYHLLINDRHIAITLLGRGGIGKTSLALKVMPRLYEANKFDAVIWFSSRDIDLSQNGAKLVRTDVVSQKDISIYYSKLLKSADEIKSKTFEPISYFESQLSGSDAGSTLFIFDNFETIDNPIETYKWLDTYIRSPNKLLITTRLRDFKGDYPLQVQGMSRDESMKLIKLTESKLGIEGNLTKDNKEKIYEIAAGHPYIMKILMGDFAKNKMKGSLEKLIAGSDEILIALFERTYSALTPCAQRVFLTLSSWNSGVPRVGLEAILMNSIDDPLEVEMAIDTLIQYSMIEEIKSDDGHYFLQLPYVAFAFGEKKIKVSPQKYLIANDVKTLRLFGVTNIDDKKISLGKNFLKYLSSIEQNDDFVVHHKKILEKICLTHHEGWKQLTVWALEINNKQFNELASDFITRYLEGDESEENKHKAWSIYALISERLHKPYEQILGLTHASDYSEITIDELSNNTNKINQIFKQNEIMLGESVKQELLDKLFNVVYSIKQKADATACSRFAWLALHLNKEKEARELTELGLRNESDNQYCIRLKRKFTNN